MPPGVPSGTRESLGHEGLEATHLRSSSGQMQPDECELICHYSMPRQRSTYRVSLPTGSELFITSDSLRQYPARKESGGGVKKSF
jgi:hypothetical protein